MNPNKRNQTARVVLSLGSNLGPREQNLATAIKALQPVLISDLYYTPPWGDPDQNDYANLVAIVERDGWGTIEWFNYTRELEQKGGRIRDPQRPYGPRTLDIDLIAATTVDTTVIIDDNPDLTLPHPRAHLRAFVLAPWHDIEPTAHIAGHGYIRDLLKHPEVASDTLTLKKAGPLAGILAGQSDALADEQLGKLSGELPDGQA